MNKSVIYLISILLMISFTTGIFVEIITPEHASVSPEIPSAMDSLLNNLKRDCFTVILAMFFSWTVYLFPCVILYILCKTFSLGFSSAFLLTFENDGLGLLLAVLFPRTMLKIPAYLLLLHVSFCCAKEVRLTRQKHTDRKKIFQDLFHKYAICFVLLFLSSLTEVLLMKVIL